MGIKKKRIVIGSIKPSTYVCTTITTEKIPFPLNRMLPNDKNPTTFHQLLTLYKDLDFLHNDKTLSLKGENIPVVISLSRTITQLATSNNDTARSATNISTITRIAAMASQKTTNNKINNNTNSNKSSHDNRSNDSKNGNNKHAQQRNSSSNNNNPKYNND